MRHQTAGLARLLLALAVALACTGCGEREAASPSRQDLAGLLPDIAGLPPRSAAVTEGKVVRKGTENDPGLMSANVNAIGPSMIYEPNGSEFTELAYAVYDFDLSGYDRDPALYMLWPGLPAEGDLYLAFANYTTLRWELFNPAASDSILLSQTALDQFLDGDEHVLVAVVLGGTQPAQLDEIRFGVPLDPPVAAVEVLPTSGDAPLFISYDMSASTDSDPGTIESYEVDFDAGNGFEASAAAGDHTYFLPGTYTLQFRVTDDDGNTAIELAEVTVNDPPNLPPTASFTADPMTGPALLPVNFDAQGSTDPEFESLLFEWDFEDDGTWDHGPTTFPDTDYTYTAAGIYTVRLRVTDESSNFDEETLTVEVLPPIYDEVENNDSQATGNTLPPLPFADWLGSMGSGDGYAAVDGDNSDWLNIGNIGEGIMVTAWMDWNPGTSLGSLMLQLYDANGVSLESAVNEDADTKRIDYVVQPGDASPLSLRVSQIPPPPGLDDYTDYFISASTS